MMIGRPEWFKRNFSLSERNAAWAMVLILVIGMLYQMIGSGLQQDFYVDPLMQSHSLQDN